MEDGPAIFKRKSSKLTGRSRTSRTTETVDEASQDAETNNGDDLEGTESPSALASKLKKKARTKPKAPVTASRLSFNDDEDEGAEGGGQTKKASLSRMALVGAATGLPNLMEQATITTTRRTDGPVYNAQYLSELKAGHAVKPPVADDMDVDSITGGIISDDTDNLPIATGNMDVTETVIPTTASIAAAKDKRGRLRTVPGAEEDFISLSLIKQNGVPSGPHPNSRLVREEDELGEGDDEFAEYTSAQERIALGKKSRKKEATQRREDMADMIREADEVDEETAEWELEQLRRGGHAAEPVQDEKPVYQPAPVPEMTPVPVLANAMGRLAVSLTQLTTSHASSTTNLAQLAKERMALDERETEVRRAVEDTEGKRAWFAAFREWIEGVAAFLDEKYPTLEKLENEHCSILRERADMIDKRRRQEDEDDLAAFLGELSPPIRSEAHSGQPTDETDSVMYRPERRAARASRRAQRAHSRAKPPSEEEGFSTDGDLGDAEADDLRAALSSLSSRAREILSDVRAPEFRDPSVGQGLAKWFGEWRTKYEDIYVGAWGGLGLVGAWELWARLELAQGPWNPLETSGEFDSMRWFHGLYQYSRPKDDDQMDADEAEDGELGPEGDLAAAMVGTAAIPRVIKLLESGAFDPYSLQHIRRMVDFGEQAELAVGRGGLKFQMLLQAVSMTFDTEASKLEERIKPFLRLNKPKFDPAAIPARRRLLSRMSKLVTCALRWRKFCGNGGQFGLAITRAVGRVTECMLKVAETGWDVGGEEVLRKAVGQIPQELVSPILKIRLA